MKDLAALASLHGEIDLQFERLRERAARDDNADEIARIEAKQRLNDQAYFVLCWGQLEVAINDRCRAVVRAGRAQADWARRRSWQLFNPDDERLSGLRFEDRAGLLLDRDGGRGSPYARLVTYYALRNSIAHGRLRPDRIDVQFVVLDLYQIQSALA